MVDHPLRCALKERHDRDSRIITILHVPFPRHIVENHRAVNVQHPPADHGMMQDIDGDVRGIDVNKVELGAFSSQL